MMNKDDHADLFSLSVRGELARMFLHRAVEPTPEEWQMLSGTREITVRDIGNMAFRCNSEAIFTIVDRADGEG